jgi:hypothetical protein
MEFVWFVLHRVLVYQIGKRLAGHVACMRAVRKYISVGIPERKRSFERPRCNWDDYMEIDIKESTPAKNSASSIVICYIRCHAAFSRFPYQ